MTIKERKILSIQYLRGLAALGVVFCHYGSGLASYPKLSSVFIFGKTGVDVFFLISGFIIVYSLVTHNYKSNQFFTFLLKRSIRIDPAYYVTVILVFVLWRVIYKITGFEGDRIDFIPQQFLAHLLYIIPFTKYSFYNHIFWTLSVEFQFYLLIGVLYFLFDTPIYKFTFLVIFSLTCFIPIPNAFYLVFTYAPIFALGIALVSFYQNKKWVNIILPLFFLGIIVYQFGLAIFILLVISSLVMLFFKLLIKPLVFLGNISYSLYLTHYPTLLVLQGLLKRLHVDSNNNQLICLFVEVLAACFVAYLFYLLIEKPSIRLSKRIFYRKKSASEVAG